MDFKDIEFWSGANYMKRLTSAEGNQTVTVGANAHQTITVAHNLGHIPGEYLVQSDLASSGRIYTNNRPYQGMDNSSNLSPTAYLKTYTDNNTLTIVVYNDTASSKTVNVSYVVYMDYDV